MATVSYKAIAEVLIATLGDNAARDLADDLAMTAEQDSQLGRALCEVAQRLADTVDSQACANTEQMK